MAKASDRERVLRLLAETEGLSSPRIKQHLRLSDERYDTVKLSLIKDGLAEKYVCRGGGLRLTRRGESEGPSLARGDVSVRKERLLYGPLIAALSRENPESVVFDTSALRKRGKWQNPDVTQITVESYRRLRTRRVLLTTYEVKQWGAWDVMAAFEAASHARFAHDGWVVLEWRDEPFALEDPRVGPIVIECRRFGVGVMTMHKYYKTCRLISRLEPVRQIPEDIVVEEWLDYALSRRSDACDRFTELMDHLDVVAGIK